MNPTTKTMHAILPKIALGTSLFICTIFPLLGQDSLRIDLFFGTGKSDLTHEHLKKLNKLDLKNCAKLEIFAFTDPVGSKEFNQLLSNKRAQNVKTFFNPLLLSDSIFAIKSFGENHKISAPFEQQRKVHILVITNNTPSSLLSGKIGAKIIADGVQFIPGTAELIESAFPVIADIARQLKQQSDLYIEVGGHVCCGKAMELSIKRAETVYLELVKLGIDKDRMTYKGYDNLEPLVPEKTEADMQKNRRVEIKILPNPR